ncbi:MAG: glycosyltransferase family 4 protein [Oscillospiraceae bacterium]
MDIAFISAYLNNHQLPISEALFQFTRAKFCFIETLESEWGKKRLGERETEPQYVLHEFRKEDRKLCREKVFAADVVIAGTPFDDILDQRISCKKLLFRYSERPLKNGIQPIKYLPRLVKWHCQNPSAAPIYMLCASAFTAGDYNKFGLFRNRCYKWGYFPETQRYADLSALLARKSQTTILWCGRFLNWKHPDDAMETAKRLKDEGYTFRLEMIGAGELESALKNSIRKYDLCDCVELLGAMSPEMVRRHMERAGIFLFTSDRQEGWGAVLNEAMNSGCAVVASDTIGSVPYLIQDGENGLVYHSGNLDQLTKKTRWLLDHPQQQFQLGEAAYHTISDLWNAEVAAKRFVQLAQAILDGEPSPDLFENGPCSRAEVIREDWYSG